MSQRSVRIEETTVATIEGWRVTVGNIMEDRYAGPDGAERRGLTAEVGLYDEARAPKGERTVGEGAALQIAGRPFTVVRVVAGEGADNGYVELAPG